MFGKARDDKKQCPLLRGPCMESRCVWWVHIRGQHPQTGSDIDMFDCAVKWLPTLLIENSKETRHTAGAVESFRNEMARQNTGLAHLLTSQDAIKRAG